MNLTRWDCLHRDGVFIFSLIRNGVASAAQRIKKLMRLMVTNNQDFSIVRLGIIEMFSLRKIYFLLLQLHEFDALNINW